MRKLQNNFEEDLDEVLRSLIYHGRGKFSPKRDLTVIKKSRDRIIEIFKKSNYNNDYKTEMSLQEVLDFLNEEN